MAQQKSYLDTTLKKIISNNKRDIAGTERACLNKKQDLIRGTVSIRHTQPDVGLYMCTLLTHHVPITLIRARSHGLGHGGEESVRETSAVEAAAEG